MLFHNNQLFLPTQNMYTLPSGEDYLREKNAHLSLIDPQYHTKTVKQQWSVLMTHFSSGLQLEHAPDEFQLETVKSRLSDFEKARANTSVSYYNVSLQQCCLYFEDFLFLYANNDPRFNLSKDAKKILLQSIVRAMGVCETGINTEFYAALQECQKDTDWVKNELSKARNECIRMLHGVYNDQNNISGALNTHVYDHFVNMANEHKLGIDKKEAILDIFAFLLDQQKLTAFFNQQFEQVFRQYEDHSVETLTTHLLGEITNVLGDDKWEQPLSDGDSNALEQVLTFHFQDVLPDAVISPFLRLDYTEFKVVEGEIEPQPVFSSFKALFKSKADCAHLVGELVKKKLLAERCYLNIEDVIADPALCERVKLHHNVNLVDLLQVYRALKAKNVGIFEDNPHYLNILSLYPKLLLIQDQDFSVLNYLLCHPSFSGKKQFFEILDRSLREAIASSNEAHIQAFLAQSLPLLRPEYLLNLSSEVRNHASIVYAIMEKDGLLFAHLNEQSQQNTHLYEVACAQNPYLRYINDAEARTDKLRDILDHMPQAAKDTIQLSDAIPRSAFYEVRSLIRYEAYKFLWTTPDINVDMFLSHVRHITPGMLANVISQRELNGLSPLPFCEQSGVFKQRLLTFHEKACAALDDTYYFNYEPWEIQKKADNDDRLKDDSHPLTYLSTTPDWFQGFMQYQAYCNGDGQRERNKHACLEAFVRVLVYVLAAYLLFQAMVFILPLAWTFVDAYFSGIILACLLSSIINYGLQNRTLATVNQILWELAFLDVNLLVAGALGGIYLVSIVYKQLVLMINHAILAVKTLQQASNQTQFSSDWLPLCEQTIKRLTLLSDPAAHQKAVVLNQILDQMADDPNTHSSLVNKPYLVTYKQKDYTVSFAEVAACRRIIDTCFSLEKPSNRGWGLFQMPTHSERLLSSILEQDISQDISFGP